MHDILDNNQKTLLPLLQDFTDKFILVGGTAIALQIGHRKSIDFDLATNQTINHQTILHLIKKKYDVQKTLIDSSIELTVIVNQVKLTFFHYPFSIKAEQELYPNIKMPALLTLAAMKAYAMGRRAKWKDYVDLYFILQKHPFEEIVKKTKEIFKNEFNEKFFREQLAYFDDIDYSEKIDYIPGFKTDDDLIKNTLTQISLE